MNSWTNLYERLSDSMNWPTDHPDGEEQLWINAHIQIYDTTVMQMAPNLSFYHTCESGRRQLNH